MDLTLSKYVESTSMYLMTIESCPSCHSLTWDARMVYSQVILTEHVANDPTSEVTVWICTSC